MAPPPAVFNDPPSFLLTTIFKNLDPLGKILLILLHKIMPRASSTSTYCATKEEVTVKKPAVIWDKLYY